MVIFGAPSAERRAIEMTYDTTANIYRSQPARGADSITRRESVLIDSDVRCALSKGSNISAQGNAQTIDHDAILFAAPEVDIMPGDTVVVTNRERNFEVIGRPDAYATHQEIRLKERGLA